MQAEQEKVFTRKTSGLNLSQLHKNVTSCSMRTGQLLTAAPTSQRDLASLTRPCLGRSGPAAKHRICWCGAGVKILGKVSRAQHGSDLGCCPVSQCVPPHNAVLVLWGGSSRILEQKLHVALCSNGCSSSRLSQVRWFWRNIDLVYNSSESLTRWLA